ncbi:uncharacterized protein LTR77_001182 [Saxophila tyrrhenica]|uniref:Uncharacterized protein n=1 Tax=Saxophila tyrrhenica TaxID=1690608 RepID=A0AAV9PP92_9PEZI|nr:hypothetical protein LTR77_001182 [Saxophila tyrrhenica]
MLATLTSDGAAGLGAPANDSVASNGAQRRPSSPQRFVDANGVPVRIPKLAVRNRRPPENSDTNDTNERPTNMIAYARSEGGGSGPPSSRSSQGTSTPGSSRSASDDTLPTRRSFASRDGDKGGKQAAGKKKKGGMLGFLTLKEPSTSAWAEFAEAEKEKARQKGARSTAVGMRGVSTQKLPDYVPKVNSKWDGLPNSAKRKSIESSKASSHRHTDSSFSSATKRSDWTAVTSNSAGSAEARRAFGSALSSPTFPNRPSTTNAPWSPDDWRVSTSASARPRPGSGLQAQPIEESEENKPQTFLLPPSPEGHDKILLPDTNLPLSPLSPLTPPELERDDIGFMQRFFSKGSPPNRQAVEMPATPPTSDKDEEPMLIGIHYPELDATDVYYPRAASPAFDHATIADSQADRKASGSPPSFAEFCRRSPINFSRPRSRLASSPKSEQPPQLSIDAIAEQAAPEASLSLSPTLVNDSGRIEPFLTDTFANHSRETGHIPQRVSSTVDPSSRHTTNMLLDESEEPSDAEEEEYTEDEDEEDVITPSAENVQPSDSASDSKGSVQPDTVLRTTNSRNSLAPSFTPSVMSEQWHQTPKERLGLGSKVRKSEVLPWENAEETGNAAEGPRRPMSPATESKRKRMSMKLGTKR